MPTATILPMPRNVFFDANGNPLVGGFVATLVPNTLTPKTTWQDAAETTPNINPILLDANGSCLLYGSGSYDIVTTDSLGNQVAAYSGVTTDTLSEASTAIAVLQAEIDAFRIPIDQNTTWYVNTATGNDANNGLSATVTSAGVGPFKTIQRALNVVWDDYDGRGFTGTISVSGTSQTVYNEGVGLVVSEPFVGFESVTLTCDAAINSVLVQGTGAALTVQLGAILNVVGGFEFATQTIGQSAIVSIHSGELYLSGVTMAAAVGGAQIFCTRLGYVELLADCYSTSGTSANLWQCSHGGNFRHSNGAKLIWLGSHNYTDCTLYALNAEIVITAGADFDAATHSATISGMQYRAEGPAGFILWASGSSISIPGNLIGCEVLGGIYSFGATPLNLVAGSFTYDMATASGAVVNIGGTFVPGAVDWLCAVAGVTSGTGGVGWTTLNTGGSAPQVATNFCIAGGAQGPQPSTACLLYFTGVGAAVSATASAVLPNGLAVTFTKTGSPTGTLTVYWRARRGL